MVLNPIVFANEVNKQFLRYQLTAFPLSDPDLARQAREIMGGSGKYSNMVKGPYVSLSRSFAEGEFIEVLVRKGIIHPAIQGVAEYKRIFAHQEQVLNAVKEDHHVLVSTGTGSGKTEAFLYPIVDHCLRLRDENAKPGIVAILVYPMNALAADQLQRLRGILAGTGVTFGMYIGATPSTRSEVTDIVRMKEGENSDRTSFYKSKYGDHPNISIVPFEERCSEEEMAESPPRILLTNVNQLEYLLTRGKDLGMFEDAPLKYLVFDEAHTYTGSKGAEVSLLIRRIRAFCNKHQDEVICIGTSATITGKGGEDKEAKRFAHRFFGVQESNVVVVKEVYQTEQWPPSRVKPQPLKGDLNLLFEKTLKIIDSNDNQIYDLISQISSHQIDRDYPWKEGLYHALKNNEMVKVIYDTLEEPMIISDATKAIWKKLGREEPDANSEMELLIYLALGATAEKEKSPILRPQLHYFVRGLGGAAVVLNPFNDRETSVKLYFSKQMAGDDNPEILPTAVFPVVTCTNCGQHFFESWLKDLETETGLQGGLTDEENIYWPVTSEEEGKRIIFTNRFVATEEEDEESEFYQKLSKKIEARWVCRYCGSLHHGDGDRCSNLDCKRDNAIVPIHLLKEHGDIKTCPCCGHKGGRSGGKYYSPLRTLKAVNVADIHILAQDMINSQKSDNRKLLIFADNRQDAAFQAAWMSDHARRYRIRHIMLNFIKEKQGPISVGDLQTQMNEFFKADKDLARAIAPEVYAGLVEDAYSSSTEELMKKYLRIQIVRELVTGYSLIDSLETLGMIKVNYFGLNPDNEFVQGFAATYNISVESAVKGIETILDVYRRGRIFFDEEEPIFSHWWKSGDNDVQRGFVPLFEYSPKGLKLVREPADKNYLVTGVNSNKGLTFAKDFVTRWKVEKDLVPQVLNDIWDILTKKLKVLTPVTLKSNTGKALGGATGVYQINSSMVGIEDQNVRYRCSVCNKYHSRDTPGSTCSKKGCSGHLLEEVPPADNYNVSLLNKEFSMLMVKEHTAQVPMKERSKIESQFKMRDGSVNCIVATPTLELGVDIGALDMVLMKNVPPLSSNYWQRAGRAGRRHRMAVIYTYCRKSVHDEYFYEDPMRMLSGKIRPPRFNLRNPVMIRKHVNATILSELVRYKQSKDTSIPEEVKQELDEAIKLYFPSFISTYLFDNNRFREKSMDTVGLSLIINRYKDKLDGKVKQVFCEEWPLEGANEVEPEVLTTYVQGMPTELEKQIKTIFQRMIWARDMKNKLIDKQKTVVNLEEIERKMLFRCQKYLEELGKNDLENYTLNVLARSGFLPGYATHQGNVIANAGAAYSKIWERMTFELTRPDTVAVREFIPGNLIYANGGKYKVAWYHLPPGKEVMEPEKYIVNSLYQNIQEESKEIDGYANDKDTPIKGITICDSDLAFMSHVSDDEENRFKLPVQMAAMLRAEHRGIDTYSVGNNIEFFHHHGQKIRLGNIGPSDKVREGILGYPFCRICGATRSPYASEAELNHFKESHKKACGEEPENYCFTADNQVDAFLFRSFPSLSDAVNLAEGIRTAANIELEMDPEDLQINLIRKSEEEYDVILYDPMPGGSGLLDQMIDQWESMIEAGIEALNNCKNNCLNSCYDCLRTYRNSFYHPNLNRFEAVRLLTERKTTPKKGPSTPPSVSAIPISVTPISIRSEVLLRKILQDHGFPPFQEQVPIPLEGSIKRTLPDFYYEDPSRDLRIAIYLDGLSKGIHGNEERMKVDHYIRTILRSKGINVIEIAASDLDDPKVMNMHLGIIGNVIKK